MPELVCAADSPDWLTERRKGITATDITAITGLSPYESAYSLYFKKRGDIPDEHEDNDRMRLGRELEPIIVARWVEQNPLGEWQARSADPGLWRNSKRPWQIATPDRIVMNLDQQLVQFASVLEVKSWADMDRDSWHDGPPARVRAQVLWQMDTLDVVTGHVGVLFLPSGEFRSYVIEHDMAGCQHAGCPHDEDGRGCDCVACQVCMDIALLRDAGLEFKNRLRDNDPPSPDASSATLAALKARFTDIHHDKTAEINFALWAGWELWKERKDHAEAKMREGEALIREQAGEARTLTVNGTKVATRVVGDAEVKAHTRHSDYIRRVPSKGDTDA